MTMDNKIAINQSPLSRPRHGEESSSSSRQLYKPQPVKATATIHPRILQEFQQQASQHLQLQESHARAAIEQSQEWHRRWTLQEEERHTHPHDADGWQMMTEEESQGVEEQDGGMQDVLPGAHLFQMLARQEGAKNPSLSSSPKDPEEEALDDASWSTSSLSLEEWRERQSRPLQPDQTPLLRPVVILQNPSPFLLPSAMCAPSPLALAPHRCPTPTPQERLEAPSDDENGFVQEETSPLTLPSSSASSVSSVAGHHRDGYESSSNSSVATLPASVGAKPCRDVEAAKEKLLQALAIAGGDVTARNFKRTIVPLWQHYKELGWDARDPEGLATNLMVEGMWLTLSKPTFFGNLGETDEGDPMYTLGRMAFDMFLPTQLVVSLQGNFNPVHVVPEEQREATLDKVPKSLMEEVQMGNHVLRTYNIVAAFTIEPHSAAFPAAPNRTVRRPIKGIMTTFGYVLPDPEVPNRLSIWFTGGKIAPNNDEVDEREWKRLFGAAHQPKRTLGEKVRVLAANLLMGAQVPTEMNPDGSLEYSFTRPLGGHGVAYMDVLYLDQTLRICRGHRGTIFVFSRIPDDGSFL